jgi:hypothetical protein
VLSQLERAPGQYVEALATSDALTRRAVAKINEYVDLFIQGTGFTPTPDQMPLIIEGITTNTSEILVKLAGGGKTSIIHRFMAAVNARSGRISLHYMPNNGAEADFSALLTGNSGKLFDRVEMVSYDSQSGWTNVRTNRPVDPTQIGRLADRAARRGQGFVVITDVDSVAWGKLQSELNVPHAQAFAEIFQDV